MKDYAGLMRRYRIRSSFGLFFLVIELLAVVGSMCVPSMTNEVLLAKSVPCCLSFGLSLFA